MEQLIELLRQIQELAGVAIDALESSSGGEAPAGPPPAAPPGPAAEGAPPAAQ